MGPRRNLASPLPKDLVLLAAVPSWVTLYSYAWRACTEFCSRTPSVTCRRVGFVGTGSMVYREGYGILVQSLGRWSNMASWTRSNISRYDCCTVPGGSGGELAPCAVYKLANNCIQRWRERAQGFATQLQVLPEAIAVHVSRLYIMCVGKWLSANEGVQAAYVITAFNSLVYLAWRIPRLQPAMRRHFTHDPRSGKAYTMLTSVFR